MESLKNEVNRLKEGHESLSFSFMSRSSHKSGENAFIFK